METMNATSTTSTTENTKDSLAAFCEAIRGETYRPYKTDLPFFDDLLGGGLIRGTLTILLAAPGAGKTALAAQVCEAIAENEKPVVYLNLEMSADQMLARTISSRATEKGTPTTALQVMQGYNWTDEQKEVIPAVIEEYRQKVYPYMKYKPEKVEATVEGIKNYLTRIGDEARAEKKEAPCIVLDYLHLITGAGDPQEMIKQVTYILKEEYAAKYNTVAVAIAAINRDSINTGSVSMTSGRDSSGIEFTADYLLGLNYYECELPPKIKRGDNYIDNPEYVNPKDPVAMGELLERETRRMILRILKGRFIKPGRSAKLLFHAPTSHFYKEGDFYPAGGDVPTFKQARRV